MELAREVYAKLLGRGIDVILDDRNERTGIKFKDCDLIGIPVRVTIGERNLKDGYAEIKLRHEKESMRVKKEELIERIMSHVEDLKRL